MGTTDRMTSIRSKMSNVDFPTTAKVQGSGNSYGVRITDVYTEFNAAYAGGREGLFIEMVTDKNGAARSVFYPAPDANSKKMPQRTEALLQHLDKLEISPDKIGGWDKLIGYNLAWTKEEKSFQDKDDKEVKYSLEYPIKVLGAPEAGAVSARASANNGAATAVRSDSSPFDSLKSLGIGKTKTELKYAVATNKSLADEFGQELQSGGLFDAMANDGIWVVESGKIAAGPNF